MTDYVRANASHAGVSAMTSLRERAIKKRLKSRAVLCRL